MDEDIKGVEEGKGGRVLSSVAKVLAVATVLASVGGVFLHLCGYIAQRSYLRAFNVDPDSFKREADWLMVSGYYSIVQLGSSVAQSVFSWPSLWLLLLLTVAVVIFRLGSSLETPEWAKKIRAKANDRSSKRAKWLSFFIESFLFSGLGWSGGYLLVMCTVLIVLIPGVMGEKFGEETARRDAARFEKGCLANNPCSEFWKDDRKIASGFVVATSSEQIAFFDTQLNMVRQLERSGIEVRSPIQPKFEPARKGAPATQAGVGSPP
ncbi:MULTISPECIES: hypothetical protein [unclassified Lysobacter]|uniref:hypothetical protein n=1 Tax=unclassified Lysobacter TaxID=2635362 RepID=UPI001BE8D128|nr:MULTISPECIES: hypothetical protein [unclassified Lysobacter]MBT2746595.1 hypothetical protein [Lysobacter sp. ISL-42]MBT2753410.1 hypothetical protein [Lysobacter sp. ISL-50]MBT2775520.1 hypothetical protein [Lysobacter sp. ISL-54]MBT2782944.1 hypothetical protein [Lysobacter sp. ISL-52]